LVLLVIVLYDQVIFIVITVTVGAIVHVVLFYPIAVCGALFCPRQIIPIFVSIYGFGSAYLTAHIALYGVKGLFFNAHGLLKYLWSCCFDCKLTQDFSTRKLFFNLFLQIRQICFYLCCDNTEKQSQTMIYKYLSLLLPNFAFVYILGMLFFFYLRLRYMRNILLTLKNMVAGDNEQDSNVIRINRKVTRVGLVVLLLLAAWLVILFQSWHTLIDLNEDRIFISIIISTLLFLAVFILGAETVRYLVHDDDFSEQKHIK
jgi:hypothetical protein